MIPLLLPSLLLAIQVARPDTVVAPFPEQVRAWTAHYSAVVDELVAADTSRLSDVQRAARLQLVTALRAYRDRADFGRGRDEGARVPHFVDAEGRRCAIAELLHVTGELGLIERVRATQNQAWILDLAADAAFERWLALHGLAFDEAARIQTPVIENGNGDTVPPPAPERPAAPEAPASGSGGGTGPGASGGTPSAGGSKSSGGPTAASLTTTSDDTWWLWWEYAKLEFLAPNRPSPAGEPITGAYVPGALREAIERARGEEFPRLVAATQAPDAVVRGAAAVALGASGGRDAVEPLLRLLGDPNQEVRHRAILALGATGSSTAAIPLLRIARTGALVDGANSSISPYARSMAIVALGLARRAGLDQSIDAVIAAIVRERTGADRDGIAIAAMFHHVIAPAQKLEDLALELALDDTESPSVRCRAVEALGSARDPKTLAKLQTILSGPRLDLRRSAAFALGATHDASVQPALMTAWELESESLTRGLVLIAIGRLGGAKAHAFLSKVLAEGESGQRRWAALALGVLARETRDPETTKLLRDALEREKNPAGRAAFWLACGLVRDESSIDRFANELATAADPRQRMYAATSLALVGGPRCAAILRERLPAESNAMARVGIAQGLGVLGEYQDARAMRGALDRLAEPALQGISATALAFHGSLDALKQLSELARGDTGPRMRRAASIEGLGLMLTRARPLALADLSRRMNYTVMPDWAQGLFQILL